MQNSPINPFAAFQPPPKKHQPVPGSTLIVFSIAAVLCATWLIGCPALAFAYGTWTPVWLGFCILVGALVLLLAVLLVLETVRANREAGKEQ